MGYPWMHEQSTEGMRIEQMETLNVSSSTHTFLLRDNAVRMSAYPLPTFRQDDLDALR
jgi:hypothetical protein